MTTEAVDLAGAAALVGLSASRFRQVWKHWREELAFPAPFLAPEDGSRYAWDAAVIRAWRADRAGAARTAEVAQRPTATQPPRRRSRMSDAQLEREQARFMQIAQRPK